jgi:hypothetical protein
MSSDSFPMLTYPPLVQATKNEVDKRVLTDGDAGRSFDTVFGGWSSSLSSPMCVHPLQHGWCNVYMERSHMGLRKSRTRLPNAAPFELKVMAKCLSFCSWLNTSVSTNTKPAAGLRVISYCDSSRLLKAEKAFHKKDVDSSSWYLKPDHDVIMTLSEERKGHPFILASRRVKSHQDDNRHFDELTRPEQLNILADRRATAALDKFRTAGKTTAFYPLPTCWGYLRDRNGRYITSREIRTLRNALPENELRHYLQRRNYWSNETYNSINWSAYSSASAGLSDSARTFVVKLTHNWLPIGVRERRCSATSDLCRHCNEVATVPHLYRCQFRAAWRHPPPWLSHRDQNCSRHTLHHHQGNRELVSDSIEIVVRIGWFQMLKGYIPNDWTSRQEALGYIPNDWTSRQEAFYRRLRQKGYRGEQWTKQIIECARSAHVGS